MNDTSEEYEIGFQQTLKWLTAGAKGSQPSPDPKLSASDLDAWWSGTRYAFIYFSEITRINNERLAQTNALLIHCIACTFLVWGVYRMFQPLHC